jgi:hypothetical protein
MSHTSTVSEDAFTQAPGQVGNEVEEREGPSCKRVQLREKEDSEHADGKGSLSSTLLRRNVNARLRVSVPGMGGGDEGTEDAGVEVVETSSKPMTRSRFLTGLSRQRAPINVCVCVCSCVRVNICDKSVPQMSK